MSKTWYWRTNTTTDHYCEVTFTKDSVFYVFCKDTVRYYGNTKGTKATYYFDEAPDSVFIDKKVGRKQNGKYCMESITRFLPAKIIHLDDKKFQYEFLEKIANQDTLIRHTLYAKEPELNISE